MLKSKIEAFIEAAKDLRVALVGETIIDEFIDVQYEGHSMKSACQVFRLDGGGHQRQQGGTAAVAGHLKEFVKSVDLFTNTNNEIVKTRYIDSFDKKKHVEINKFDTSGFKPINIDTSKYDVTIVADFGHGFCNQLNITDGFHLMCQTNSNNFGFNRISKWKNYRKKSVCLDLREASLQMNRAIVEKDSDVVELFNYEMNTENMFVTIGAHGVIYTDGKQVLRHPAYPSQIVDTIGAGDTFFSFACLLAALGKPVEFLPIPALAASLSTTWLCNEKSVTRESLLEYSKRFDS